MNIFWDPTDHFQFFWIKTTDFDDDISTTNSSGFMAIESLARFPVFELESIEFGNRPK